MSRVRFNTNDSTYVDGSSYDIDLNVQLNHEILERCYGNMNPNLDENSGEEVEVDSGEDELEETPTSPVTKVSTETTNLTEQNCGPPPPYTLKLLLAYNVVQGTLDPSNPSNPLTQCKYNKERDRKNLAKMVFVCNLPYSFSLHPCFIEYI
ncbi:hypothetical protein H5410_048207 [Solanum commersonii]|uniref:Uncharacterized protein n=1 Tax=Solanum commersonii TaxID=4109 RepID=A0A9J5XJ41_SOLCO|nr:hypothetical protein H5410_048207 [Solanum commersonii]